MGLSALIPWWIGRTIDSMTAGDATVRELGLRSLVLVLLVGSAALLTLVQERCDTKTRVVTALHAMTWVHHQTVRLAGSTVQSSAGAVINLGLGDIRPIGDGVASLTRGVGGLTAILAVGLILLTYSWQLCVMVLLGTVLLLRINDRLLKPYRASQKVVRERMGDLTGFALNVSSGLRVIKGLGAADRFSARYRAVSQDVRSAATTVGRSEGAVVGNRALAGGLLSTATVWLGATLVQAGSISVGDLVAAYGYGLFLAVPMRWLLTTRQQWVTARVSVERVGQYLDLQSGSDERPMVYDGTVSDPDMGWQATPGEYTVVASTEPIDWAEVAERLCDHNAAPASFRVIRADDYLFSGPMMEVLDPSGEAAPSAMGEAAHTAALTDVIKALPDGINHKVTAGGIDFSGGEQQRIRLARALLAAPATLVLIDPTSALDATTEVEVARRLRVQRAGTTTVVLTNSPPHLVEADRVILLSAGGVAATGAHADLIGRPDYRAMVGRSEVLT